MAQCHVSILRNVLCHVTYSFSLTLLCSMSHVDFKKLPCRPIVFSGLGPCKWAVSIRPVVRDRRGGSVEQGVGGGEVR